MRPSRASLAVLAALAAWSCGMPSDPADPGMVVRPIQIDSVDVLAQAPVSARVKGVIGDGCTELQGVDTQRSGNAVTITILATRPQDAICTQIAKLYDAVLPLPGAYPAGSYVLRVNAVEKTFVVP